MKAAAFDYVRPSSVEEVCGYLADEAADAQIIAGGQSLVPMMAMRLVRPALLVDVNEVADLQGISRDDDTVVIRACTRQAEAERSAVIRDAVPLLAKALPFVGHDQIRNRGTIGGSLAQADPSAEICLAAVALNAEVTLASSAGERRLPVSDFLIAPMTTALDAGDCVTEIRFPRWPDADRIGVGFHEVSSRDSDFAIVAAAAQLAFDPDGVCSAAAVAIANAAPTPIRLNEIEDALIGGSVNAQTARDVAGLADASLAPDADLHASVRARYRIARSLIERAIAEAAGADLSGDRR